MGKERGPLCSFMDPSSTVMSRAWRDERWDVPWSVAALLAELALAFPTHDDDDANGAQNPCTDEPSDSEAVPVIVKWTVFIFRVVGIQGRQAWREKQEGEDMGAGLSEAGRARGLEKGPLMDRPAS